MMPGVSSQWHLSVLLASLAGFACLALAAQREGELLLRRAPGLRLRRTLRVLGWGLIGLALIVGMLRWHARFGAVLWFGWLTVASVVLIFAIPYAPWRVEEGARLQRHPRRTGSAQSVGAVPPPILWRGLLMLLLLGLPLSVAWTLYQAPLQPVLRADALSGRIGPWGFVVAEEWQAPPEISPSGVPVKSFALRFCDGCDSQIRAAYFRLREPRPPRSSGMALRSAGGMWEVQIQVPAAVSMADGFWLTVVGMDGETFHERIDIARLSPGMVQFIQERDR